MRGMNVMGTKVLSAAALLTAGMIVCFGASCVGAETAGAETAAEAVTAEEAVTEPPEAICDQLTIREHADAALDAIFWKEEAAWYGNEIEFDGYDEWMEDAHLMLASYETENKSLQNAAFTYDNALAAMALIAEGWDFSARNILDSFVYAVRNDRYQPGRIRNAYFAGNINPYPFDETSGARLPGWWDDVNEQWAEDRYQVGCNTGNTSYAALALLQYDAVFGDDPEADEYVETAAALMDWVIDNCSDDGDGFTGGCDGWPEADPPVVSVFTYKSIEHNIDAYAAFSRLYEVTGEERYREAAENALRFIDSMYDREKGVFYTGTYDDGVTPDRENIVLDAQVWAALALGDALEPYEDSLQIVEKMKQDDGGYAFCLGNANGGWWSEGTAFTALMYKLRGEEEKAEQILETLGSIQNERGEFPAATVDNLSTGLYQFDGAPLEYSTDSHLAPTAWFILAADGFNPYDFSK